MQVSDVKCVCVCKLTQVHLCVCACVQAVVSFAIYCSEWVAKYSNASCVTVCE